MNTVTLEFILDELKEIKAHIKKERKFPYIIDPIEYTDVSGEKGSYRRVGNRIEFTAIYPPRGIDIKTDTLIVGYYKSAEVIGWSYNESK